MLYDPFPHNFTCIERQYDKSACIIANNQITKYEILNFRSIYSYLFSVTETQHDHLSRTSWRPLPDHLTFLALYSIWKCIGDIYLTAFCHYLLKFSNLTLDPSAKFLKIKQMLIYTLNASVCICPFPLLRIALFFNVMSNHSIWVKKYFFLFHEAF